jgi:hypothetical protein
MSPVYKNKILTTLFICILLTLGIFKDSITPDYLNTPTAYFLNPKHPDYVGIWRSHWQMPKFWIIAYLYSILHILIPFYIIKLIYGKSRSRYALYVLVLVFMVQYGILYTNIEFLTTKLLPKINRYFHSPLLIFIVAAGLTLLNKNDKN